MHTFFVTFIALRMKTGCLEVETVEDKLQSLFGVFTNLLRGAHPGQQGCDAAGMRCDTASDLIILEPLHTVPFQERSTPIVAPNKCLIKHQAGQNGTGLRNID